MKFLLVAAKRHLDYGNINIDHKEFSATTAKEVEEIIDKFVKKPAGSSTTEDWRLFKHTKNGFRQVKMWCYIDANHANL